MTQRRNTDTRWSCQFGNAGWVTVEQHKGKLVEKVLVRVKPDTSGRYLVRELYLFDNGAPITAARLRAVRVAAIESLLNLPEYKAAIEARINLVDAIDLAAEAGSFATTTSPRRRSRPLVAPEGRGYSDEFYAQVAENYKEALERGSKRPVEAIAAEARPPVPRSTAGRWVKEARRRGHLGPAQPGKAGS